MRTSGRPSASTVASDIALGSLGSAFTASANQSPNSANGSSASVKSPDVNGVGCLMEVVSAISGVPSCIRPRSRARCSARIGLPYIGHGDALARMDENEATSSIAGTQAAVPTPTDNDLARNAASDVLTKGDKDSSQPW